VWRVWQTTQELVDYAKECCVFRELTEAKRVQFSGRSSAGAVQQAQFGLK
jgi:hypothetical protein